MNVKTEIQQNTMKALFTILFFVACLDNIHSQIVLKPHIGLSSLPLDTDSICYFEPYTGNFNVSGYQQGDTVNDFTLFSLSGDTLNLRRELMKGKPVVLVSCSYTCPVYRNKLQQLNQIYSQYSDSVSIFLIYTIEAHPYPDISPYFGYVNPGQANINAGILFPLSRTYGMRKTMVWRNDSALSISPPVFIDGTCDQWLRHFGPAPNNAYLITKQGIVFAKHPWFNRPPDNLASDIDSLLGLGGGGGGGQFNGVFNFTLTGDSSVTGQAGKTVYGYGDFINTSGDTAIIRAVREEENLPPGWASSICIDVCYPPTVDTAIVYLAPGDTQHYVMYFYTDSIPGSGNIKMRFENVNVQGNYFVQRFYCTTNLTGINSPENTFLPDEPRLYQNYPNPFNPLTKITYYLSVAGNISLKVYDVLGNEVAVIHEGRKDAGLHKTDFSGTGLSSGVYYYRLTAEGNTLTMKMLLIK
jgi:hypothetical protein